MLNDLRHGLRVLLQAKVWTAVVVLSLALGIGANAALFSAVNALLLRELPVREPDSLVRLRIAFAERNDMAIGSSDYGSSGTVDGQKVRASFSHPMFLQLRTANQTLDDLFACAPMGRINVVADGTAGIANAFISSGNYYEVLGVNALVGRTIVPADDDSAAAPVAVISHQYWKSRFASDPQVVGKVVTARGVPVTIVGVLPTDFTGVQRTTGTAPDIAFPLALDAQLSPATGAGQQRLKAAASWWLQMMGRLKPGVSSGQVQGNLAGVFQAEARAGMDAHLASLPETERFSARNRNRTQVPRLLVEGGHRGIYDATPEDLRSVTTLGLVVGIILLIVCANVANLLLSRATMREKEISIRLSSGATRGRLIRQLMTESLLLAVIGGGIGVLFGYWGAQLLPGELGAAASLEWRVLMFALLVTTTAGIVFGIAPALRATSMNISTTLKENSRGVAASRTLLSRGLVVVQVALSLLLLVGAGLLLRTVQNLRHADVGFNRENLVLFQVDPQMIRYEPRQFGALYGELIDRVRAVPGVIGVTFSNNGLLTGSQSSTDIFVDGRQSDGPTNINRLTVGPGFFETIGMPLLTGRAFETRDGANAPKVIVINQAAAEKLFPNANPLGRRFGESFEKSNELEVIGVIRDAKYSSVRSEAPPTVYVPFAQGRQTDVVFEVRTALEPANVIPGIRQNVAQLHPNLPLINVSTQTEQIEGRLEQERLFAQAYAVFGGLALTVAGVGLFGLMSYSVTKRTKEMGIRLAIGAAKSDVLWLVLRDSLMLVGVGIAIGLVGVVAAGGVLSSLLYGITPTDSATILVASAVMLSVSALAGYLPARRAARVDPMTALRYE